MNGCGVPRSNQTLGLRSEYVAGFIYTQSIVRHWTELNSSIMRTYEVAQSYLHIMLYIHIQTHYHENSARTHVFIKTLSCVHTNHTLHSEHGLGTTAVLDGMYFVLCTNIQRCTCTCYEHIFGTTYAHWINIYVDLFCTQMIHFVVPYVVYMAPYHPTDDSAIFTALIRKIYTILLS